MQPLLPQEEQFGHSLRGANCPCLRNQLHALLLLLTSLCLPRDEKPFLVLAACLDHGLRFREVASLDVELCLSLVCVRTHLVPDKPEQCPASSSGGCSLPELSDPPTPYLTHLFKHAHPCHPSLCGRGQRHIERSWGKKAISVAVHGLERHQTAGHSPKGCSLALGALL
uniref:Uncharacterized protein n=1 Tax=Ficedula albicollis TaxID=59894 RepID=A0A803VDB7_FICAL